MVGGPRAEMQAEGTRTPTPEAADQACNSAAHPSIWVAKSGIDGGHD